MELAVSDALVVKGSGGDPSPHYSLTVLSIESRITGTLHVWNQLTKPSKSVVLGWSKLLHFETAFSTLLSRSMVSHASTSPSMYTVPNFLPNMSSSISVLCRVGTLQTCSRSFTFLRTWMKHVKCCAKPNSCLNASMRGCSPSVPTARTPSRFRHCPMIVDAKRGRSKMTPCSEYKLDQQTLAVSWTSWTEGKDAEKWSVWHQTHPGKRWDLLWGWKIQMTMYRSELDLEAGVL